MSLKLKIIGLIILLVTIISTIISLFVYINKLNNEITNLNVTITNQEQTITQLNNNIQSLEMNLTAIYNTINITNDYIENIEKVHQKEVIAKQEIYETIVEDPVTKEWYDEQLPNALLNILMKETNSFTCDND